MPGVTFAAVMDLTRQAIVRVEIIGDGEGEVDRAEIYVPTVPSVCLDKIQYGLIGFDCRLDFAFETGDVPAWSIAKGNGVCDFGWMGSLPDRSNEMGGSGKLILTTSGLKAGDFGSLIIAMTKKS